MTRARAAWLTAAIVLVAALGYLVRRRAHRPTSVVVSAPTVLRTTAVRNEDIPTTEEAVISEPPPIEQAAPAGHEVRAVVADDDEQPLATWIRVAIVGVALLAFFAVSLIATKQV